MAKTPHPTTRSNHFNRNTASGNFTSFENPQIDAMVESVIVVTLYYLVTYRTIPRPQNTSYAQPKYELSETLQDSLFYLFILGSFSNLLEVGCHTWPTSGSQRQEYPVPVEEFENNSVPEICFVGDVSLGRLRRIPEFGAWVLLDPRYVLGA